VAETAQVLALWFSERHGGRVNSKQEIANSVSTLF
jgi:hypothetical protein